MFLTTNGTNCSHEIQLIMDDLDEGLETFSISLTINSPSDATFIRPGADGAMVTILNDDGKYHFMLI